MFFLLLFKWFFILAVIGIVVVLILWRGWNEEPYEDDPHKFDQ